jgi:hypothetical protein
VRGDGEPELELASAENRMVDSSAVVGSSARGLNGFFPALNRSRSKFWGDVNERHVRCLWLLVKSQTVMPTGS